MNLEQLGYKLLKVYYMGPSKIMVSDQGVEKTYDGKQTFLTWDELQALSSMKGETTENNLKSDSTEQKKTVTENNPEQPVQTEKKRSPYKRRRVYTVIDKYTGNTVCKDLTSTEAFQKLGMSSVNAFRIVVSNQKNGRPHKRWEIRE